MNKLTIYLPDENLGKVGLSDFITRLKKDLGKSLVSTAVLEELPERLVLHPKQRIDYARSIPYLLMHYDVYLITCDDYIIRELSNMLMLGCLPESMYKTIKKADKYKVFKGFKYGMKLDAANIEAYILKGDKKSDNYKLKKCRIEQKSGIYGVVFDDVIEAQNELQGSLVDNIIKYENTKSKL